MFFTRKLIDAIWPQWSKQAYLLFQRMVLGRDQALPDFKPGDSFTKREFILIAMERWMASVLSIEPTQRYLICVEVNKSPMMDNLLAEFADEETETKGYFLTLFNDTWLTWTGEEEALNLFTGERRRKLPPPVWQITLNVTALYFAALSMPASEEGQDAQHTEEPA